MTMSFHVVITAPNENSAMHLRVLHSAETNSDSVQTWPQTTNKIIIIMNLHPGLLTASLPHKPLQAAASGSLRVESLWVGQWEDRGQEHWMWGLCPGASQHLREVMRGAFPLSKAGTITQVGTLDQNRSGEALCSSLGLQCPALHPTPTGILPTLQGQINNCSSRKPFLIFLLSLVPSFSQSNLTSSITSTFIALTPLE